MKDEQAARDEIDRLTAAFFGLFSNLGGARPELETIFDLFLPQGLIAKCGDRDPEIMTLHDFIAPRRELLSNGSLTEFSEVETSATTQILGSIATRWSVYQKSGCREGTWFSARGVKSFQFVETPRGWRILSMSWDDERPGFTIA